MRGAPPAVLPNWPALMPIDLACQYVQMGVDSFRLITRRHGVEPVDIGLSMTRYRKADLDRLIDSLPARGAEMPPEGRSANDPQPDVDPAEAALERARRRARK